MTRKILVVDDDPDFVEIIRTVLLAHNYQVITASNGDQALDAMRQQHPDLVVLDVMMSTILDGLNVSFQVAEDPQLKEIPIIMVSSIADSAYAEQFPTDEYVPIAAWISKPVQPDDLIQKVERILGS